MVDDALELDTHGSSQSRCIGDSESARSRIARRLDTDVHRGIVHIVLDALAVNDREARDIVFVHFGELDVRADVDPPADFIAERLAATRDAQTNIMLAAAERGTRTLMVTSPQSSETRTAFSLDLADLFARSGHKVLIVDADTAQSFMTQMLMPHGLPQAQNVLSATEQSNVWSYLQPTPLPNVALLPGQSNPRGSSSASGVSPGTCRPRDWLKRERKWCVSGSRSSLRSGGPDVHIVDAPSAW